MNLRTRLTAVHTAVLGAVLTVSALIVGRAQMQAMREHFDERLVSAERVVDYAVRDRRTDAGTEAAAADLLRRLRVPDVAVAIAEVRADRASALIFAGSDSVLLRALPRGSCRPQETTARLLDGQPYHVRVHCVPAEGAQPQLAVVLGASEQPLQAQRRHLERVLAFNIVIGLVLAAVIGHWLSGKAIAPIRNMTTAVQQIGAEQLDQRLPVRATDGEIAELCRMINGLFDRLADVVARERRFLANAAHALRTPVAILRAEVSESVDHATHGAPTRAVLAEITESVEHLSRTVEYLLSLARRDSGTEVPLTERMYLDDVATGTVARMTRVLAERGIALHWGALDETPVLANTHVADQVLQILLENAARYCPPGSTVTIGVRAGSAAGELVVADDGPGLTEADREILFTPFLRGAAARETRARGSGLGLAVAEWLVQSVGGEISADAHASDGARFIVRFRAAASAPINGRSDAVDPSPRRAEVPAGSQTPRG